jgi:hypothetical protein
VPAAWVERFEATSRPRAGWRIDRDELLDAIAADVRTPGFWIDVRERLRARGRVPRVIDDPDGEVSVVAEGCLTLCIRVRHRSLDDARSAPAAAAIFQTLHARVLFNGSALEPFSTHSEMSTQLALDERGVVAIAEAELGALPDRAPLRHPKRVQPKGVIRSKPRRRDEY